MQDNPSDWVNLVVLIVLVGITGWYAYSTHRMLNILKETFEWQTVPLLITTFSKVKLAKKDQQEAQFNLVMTNAGSYSLIIRAVTFVGNVKKPRGTSGTIIESDEFTIYSNLAVPLTPLHREHVMSCRASISKWADNLRVRVDFEDAKGHSHSRDFTFPAERN